MIEKLAAHGRKMVTIIDPHIKRDANYHIHKEAEKLGLYIKVTPLIDGPSDGPGHRTAPPQLLQ